MTSITANQNEQDKGLIRRLYGEGLGQGNMELVRSLVAPNFVNHSNGLTGPEGFIATVLPLRKAFPDIRYTIDDLVAEDGRVAVRLTVEGTHRAPFAGIEATGKPVTQHAIVIYRCAEGKLAESWIQVDRLAMLEQLGVAPGAARPAGA